MLKVIRNNQKKILAVICVVSMFVFVKGLAPSSMQSGSRDAVIGTLNGTKVTQSELNIAHDEWQTLEMLRFRDPNRPDQTGPLVQFMFGDTWSLMHENPRIFYFLTQEALDQEITVNPEELKSLVVNNIADLPAEGTSERDRIEDAMSDALLVQADLKRAQDMVKVTRPMRRWLLAENRQTVSLNMVNLPASHYMDKIPAPTDQQIHNQYDAYSDRIPGNFGAEGDPMGFGYKIDNRVKLQFMGVKHDDIRRAAEASKSQNDWLVAAYGEFQAHRTEYDDQPIPAATQPSAATLPSTQPVVRRLDNVDDDFQLHAPLVLEDLYKRETETLTQTILRKITDGLKAGYGVYHDAQASGTSSSEATHYTSMEFLIDLSQTIEKQYGVLPVRGDIDQFKTREELGTIDEIGKAVVALPSGQEIPFAAYAIDLLQPYVTDAVKTQGLSGWVLTPWEPSLPLATLGGDVYIFRVTGTDPAHPAAFADAKDRCASDFKLDAAYDLADAAARLTLTDAQRRGLRAAAANVGAPVITTDPFSPSEIQLSLQYNQPAVIKPLNLKPDSLLRLSDAAEKLLANPVSAEGRPIAVADLYAEAMPAVIELNSATPEWDESNPGMVEAMAITQVQKSLIPKLWTSFAKYQNVVDRMKFKLEEGQK